MIYILAEFLNQELDWAIKRATQLFHLQSGAHYANYNLLSISHKLSVIPVILRELSTSNLTIKLKRRANCYKFMH